MKNITRFFLCLTTNFLGLLEGILVVFHVISTALKRLLEKGAKIIIVFLMLFCAMYIIVMQFDDSAILAGGWKGYVTIVIVAVLLLAVFLLRSIGATLFVLMARVIEWITPTSLISSINMVTEKMADKYISLGEGRVSDNKYIFAVHTVLYWVAEILRIPLRVLSFAVPLVSGGYLGYSIGFVWSAPPVKTSLDWFLCVGIILLFVAFGIYIGYIFSDTLKLYYVPEVDGNEDS